jgi:hypothetical protein
MEETTPRRHHRPRPEVGGLDGFPFQLAQPDDTDFVLGYDWPYGGSISQLRITCDYGSGQVSVLLNNQVVTGLDHVPVSANARSEHNAEGLNLFRPGDDIILRINSGAPSLLNVRGTLVVTNKAIFSSQIISPSPWFTEIEIPITPDLVGQTIIPYAISPQLRRNPIHIFPATMQKNSPSEDDVIFINYEPFTLNDYTSGWNFVFSGGAVLGQILRSAFIP